MDSQMAAPEEMGPGGVPRGAQTHQYYRTEDIPTRFDNPGQRRKVVYNGGNPVATCSYPPDISLPPTSRATSAQIPGVPSSLFSTLDLGQGGRIAYVPGQPVVTCDFRADASQTTFSTARTPQPEDWFQGYGGKKQHPMYITTTSSYGAKPPSVHTMPTQFYARSQKFSEHLGQCGMYRNYSLNTEVDKSKV